MAITENGVQATMPVTPAYGNSGFGGFGGNGDGLWVLLFFVLLLGNGNWGNWGGNGNGSMPGYSQVNDFSQLERENDIIRSDICDGFANVNQSLANGFQNIQTSFANAELSRSNTQAALMGQMYSMSMADLQRGCDIQSGMASGFAQTNYNLASQNCETRNTIQNSTRDIIDSQREGTNAILGALTAQAMASKDERIAELTQKVNSLENANINNMQSAYLLQTLRPYPVPAFTVVPPGTTTGGTTTTTPTA